MNFDRVKSTIRAMLNLAADEASTPAEKEQAMRRVTKLMDEHNLREEDLADADGILDSLDNVEVGKVKINVGTRQCMWHGALAVFVKALLLDTIEVFSVKNYVSKTVDIAFMGVLSDCEIAVEIFIEVRDMIDDQARERYGKAKRGDGYRYAMGFAGGLQEQLKHIKAMRPSSSTALIVARNAIVVRKQSLAKRLMQDEGFKTRKQSAPRVEIDDAFHFGWQEGLHHIVNSDRRRKLVG